MVCKIALPKSIFDFAISKRVVRPIQAGGCGLYDGVLCPLKQVHMVFSEHFRHVKKDLLAHSEILHVQMRAWCQSLLGAVAEALEENSIKQGMSITADDIGWYFQKRSKREGFTLLNQLPYPAASSDVNFEIQNAKSKYLGVCVLTASLD